MRFPSSVLGFVWLEFAQVLRIAQPSLEELLLVVVANSHRDPQLDTVQRAGDFGALAQPWMGVFLTFLPSRLTGVSGKGSRQIIRVREDGGF